MTDARSAPPPRQGKPRSIQRRILLGLITVVVIVLLGFVAMVGSFLYLGHESAQQQQTRVDAIRADTASTAPGWSDSSDLTIDGTLPYNRMQFVATHNSYVLEPIWLQRTIIDLVEPGEGALLQYGHGPLWDQLEAGIRSFELDVRWNGTAFVVSHVPLVANRATVPNFALALEEIRLWSDRHPGHLPISIMIEPKSDYMFLDPTLKDFDAAAWDTFDAVLTAGFGHKLFAPDALRGTAVSLREAVGSTGWPSTDRMRDSVLFFLSDGERMREQYLAGHEDLAGRSMFTSSKTAADDAVFAVRDDPTEAAIATDVAAGVIVRTRADADLKLSKTARRAALASGAQIVSTDFPPSEPQAGSGYTFAFPGDALVRAQ